MADVKKFTATPTEQTVLKLSLPNTREAEEFLEKLKHLLNVTDLPFVETCPPTGDGPGKKTLHLHMDQEGWP